ncbi:MAG: hypothetical protein LH616_02405 [Ilumatobacteraceae bacterium]|nr:hypothetical protein [Ilumatobacteraceae bacterium]
MEGPARERQAVVHTLTEQLPHFTRASVLHLGDDDLSVIDALTVNADHVANVGANDAITLQLERRFDLVVVGTRLLAECDDGHRRALMHAAMQHVEREGHLIVLHEAAEPVLGDGFWANDLHLLGSYPLEVATLSLYQRGHRTTVHDLLFEARAIIARVPPDRLAERMQADDGTLVLDTRTHTDRERFGVIPGAVHVPRTVVEWHFDPANGYLHPAMRSFDQPLVLVCNGGYSSSLAAANLVRLGFTNVADLIGGHTAWAAAGLPVARPDHSHLDSPSFDEQGFSEGL